MAADDDTPHFTESIIMRVREQVHRVRDQYHVEVSHGKVTDVTHLQLARVVLTYHGALREFRDHAAVKEHWRDETSVVSEISRLRNQTTIVPEEYPGNTRATKGVEAPAIREESADRLVEMTHELDDVANELGFAERPRDKTPHDEPDHEDLRGLAQIRGQEEAVERIPGDD